ncbi:MAG: hypothetical protein WC478_06260 [Candidatus Omnitrophota bacterium]
MSVNRNLQVAFFISFAAHVAVVAQNPGSLFFPSPHKPHKIEVNYIKKAKAQGQAGVRPVAKREPPLNLSSRITMDKRNPPPFIEREANPRVNMQAIRREAAFGKPASAKPDIIAIKKKITLPAVELKKISNPSYISYYQLVREKIRRAAYQNYDRDETGEVYLTFMVSSAGYLQEARLVEEKTRAASYLKEIALASVRTASPFPSFPKELDYPQLSFNVVISFEVE